MMQTVFCQALVSTIEALQDHGAEYRASSRQRSMLADVTIFKHSACVSWPHQNANTSSLMWPQPLSLFLHVGREVAE